MKNARQMWHLPPCEAPVVWHSPCIPYTFDYANNQGCFLYEIYNVDKNAKTQVIIG